LLKGLPQFGRASAETGDDQVGLRTPLPGAETADAELAAGSVPRASQSRATRNPEVSLAPDHPGAERLGVVQETVRVQRPPRTEVERPDPGVGLDVGGAETHEVTATWRRPCGEQTVYRGAVPRDGRTGPGEVGDDGLRHRPGRVRSGEYHVGELELMDDYLAHRPVVLL